MEYYLVTYRKKTIDIHNGKSLYIIRLHLCDILKYRHRSVGSQGLGEREWDWLQRHTKELFRELKMFYILFDVDYLTLMKTHRTGIRCMMLSTAAL